MSNPYLDKLKSFSPDWVLGYSIADEGVDRVWAHEGSSVADLDIVLHGHTERTTDGPTNDTDARWAYFDGSSGSYGAAAEGITGLADFTMTAWVRSDDTAQFGYLFSSHNFADGNYRSWAVTFRGTGASAPNNMYSITYSTNGGAPTAIDIGGGIPGVGVWDHVVMTRSGSTITTYRNGVSVGTATNDSVFYDTDQAFMMLATVNGSTDRLSGDIYAPALWDGTALSAAQVDELYQSSFADPGEGDVSVDDSYDTELLVKYPSPSPVLTDLILHLDASDSASVIRDGSNRISQWNDLSGLDNHVEPYATDQPLYVENELNGEAIVRFLQTRDEFMETLAQSWNTRSISMFFVARTDSLDRYYLCNYRDYDRFYLTSSAFYLGDTTYDYPNDYNQQWAVFNVQLNATGGDVRVDGEVEVTILDTPPDRTFDRLRVGGGNTGTFIDDGFRTGTVDIAEVMVYSAALSESDREAVRGYLTTKWVDPSYLLNDYDTELTVIEEGQVSVDYDTELTIVEMGQVSTDYDTELIINVTEEVQLLDDYDTSLTVVSGGVPVKQDLILHLDALDTDSVVRDGSNRISQWNDLSGLNNHVEPHATDQPLYVENELNGGAIVRFLETRDEFMEVIGPQWNMRSISMFFVARTDSLDQYYLCNYRDSDRFYFTSSVFYAGNTAYSYANDYNQQWAVFNVQLDDAGGDVRVDGEVETTIPTAPPNRTFDRLRVGGGNTGTTITDTYRTGTVDIAEVLIYSSDLSESDREAVRGYLTTKWTNPSYQLTDYDTDLTVFVAEVLDVGDTWFFFADSQYAGRATDEPTAADNPTAFYNIWGSTFGNTSITRSINGITGGATLLDSWNNYLTTPGIGDATWVQAAESGSYGQNGRGQEDVADFGDTFEGFMRDIALNSPNAVITYETAMDTTGRYWEPFNVEMRSRVEALALDGITVHIVRTRHYIEKAIEATSFSTVFQDDDAHYAGFGNFVIALAMFDLIGYEVDSLDLSGISDSDISPTLKSIAVSLFYGVDDSYDTRLIVSGLEVVDDSYDTELTVVGVDDVDDSYDTELTVSETEAGQFSIDYDTELTITQLHTLIATDLFGSAAILDSPVLNPPAVAENINLSVTFAPSVDIPVKW